LWRLLAAPEHYFRNAATPLDSAGGNLAAQWKFMSEARHAVLPGSSYTVRSRDLHDEMNFFRLSLPLTPKREAISPTTRSHRPNPEADEARFVVLWGAAPRDPNLRFVVRFEGGVVYERIGGAK
jgi:hypothetical protein